MNETEVLYREIRSCRVCEPHLPLGANPVLVINRLAKILIIGQAPGLKVHQSGKPWDDQSGKELRAWLGVDEDTFYCSENFGIVPIGFCYPGKGKNGDLPPRKECALLWQERVLEQMPNVELILLVGQYAQAYYLKKVKRNTLTETVKNYQEYLPLYLPLPHPSPRNFIWMAKNPWFKSEVLPVLQERVLHILEEVS